MGHSQLDYPNHATPRHLDITRKGGAHIRDTRGGKVPEIYGWDVEMEEEDEERMVWMGLQEEVQEVGEEELWQTRGREKASQSLRPDESLTIFVSRSAKSME